MKKIIFCMIKCGIICGTVQTEKSGSYYDSVKQILSSCVFNTLYQFIIPVFDLDQNECEVYQYYFIEIRKYNLEVLNFCNEFSNLSHELSVIENFTKKLEDKVMYCMQERSKSEYLLVFPYEYFKFVEYLYKTLLFIVHKKQNHIYVFGSFINEKIIPLLEEMNDVFTKFEFSDVIRWMSRILSYLKWYQKSDSTRCKLLMNFLNEYLEANDMMLLHPQRVFMHTTYLLHLGSNFLVRCFFTDRKLFAKLMREAKNPISYKYQGFLILDCELTRICCRMYSKLAIYLNEHHRELQRTLFDSDYVVPALNHVNSYAHKFGAKDTLLVVENEYEISDQTAIAA